MTVIKITPEELDRIGGQFLKCSEYNKTMASDLEKLIKNLSAQWQGSSKERFYKSYTSAEQELKNVSVMLKDVGDELKAIAERFRQADQTN
ncbi:WXG100 family type VII secretion target [Paenibacillus harenae]|uniref:ESAT-6-like protein n=1 Tax=Paenibacillus harenae TaxID=306543 RepID=A0ABT9TTJ4_PAEHA|nr:WXG100 family type VII secretion target [Paenibacillus harenae]MDQ0110661.1 WXG100 family type VII secretion target [Paenibacillus harenae]